MKVKNKYPPNYQKIVKYFPFIKGKYGIVFTYGNKLYAPGKPDIPEHLMKHEETHLRQQQNHPEGVKGWWNEYIKSKQFRLKQELEAYQNQYIYAKAHLNRQQRRKLLRKISKDLSSKMYGKIISKKKAKRLIKNNKTVN